MSAKILVASSSKKSAQALAQALKPLRRGVDVIVGSSRPRRWDSYRLLICELGPRLPSIDPLLERLRKDAYVVVIMPALDVLKVATSMLDRRINHLLCRPVARQDIAAISTKLATGAIFGMERYLPPQVELVYRRLSSYRERCDVLEELDAFMKRKRLRGAIRRSGMRVGEELLMNAMYQAPVDENGDRIFADVSPRARLRRRTPKPVSMRYGVHGSSLYLSVRDRYGSLDREDLVNYLYRCSTSEQQIEQKQLGAGLGLYLITSTVSRMIVNLLPGGVTEFICVLEPTREQRLKLFSFTSQRPMIANAALDSSSEEPGLGSPMFAD